MARRKRRKARSRRSAPRRAPVRRKRSRSGVRKFMKKDGLVQIDSMLYGGVREYASNKIAPLTQKIPLGGLADEAGMGVLNWAAAKYGKGMLRDVALKGLVVENARVGEAIAKQGFGLLGGAAASSAPAVHTYG